MKERNKKNRGSFPGLFHVLPDQPLQITLDAFVILHFFQPPDDVRIRFVVQLQVDSPCVFSKKNFTDQKTAASVEK